MHESSGAAIRLLGTNLKRKMMNSLGKYRNENISDRLRKNK